LKEFWDVWPADKCLCGYSAYYGCYCCTEIFNKGNGNNIQPHSYAVVHKADQTKIEKTQKCPAGPGKSYCSCVPDYSGDVIGLMCFGGDPLPPGYEYLYLADSGMACGNPVDFYKTASRSQTYQQRAAVQAERAKTYKTRAAVATNQSLPCTQRGAIQGNSSLSCAQKAAVEGEVSKAVKQRAAVRTELLLEYTQQGAVAATFELPVVARATVQGNPRLNYRQRAAIKGEAEVTCIQRAFVVKDRTEAIRLEMENLVPQQYYQKITNSPSTVKDWRKSQLGG